MTRKQKQMKYYPKVTAAGITWVDNYASEMADELEEHSLTSLKLEEKLLNEEVPVGKNWL